MICPHCGKEMSTNPCTNFMDYINGCNPYPLYLNLNNANGCNPVIATFVPTNTVCAPPIVNLAANACNPYPQVTFIKF